MAAKLCNVCDKRRVGTTGSDPASARLNGMCGLCMDEGGWENTHSDYNHDAIAKTPVGRLPKGWRQPGMAKGEVQKLLVTVAEERKAMQDCWVCHPELNKAANWKPGKKGATKAQGTRRPQLNHKGHKHPQSPAARRACKLAFWASMTTMPSNEELGAAMAAWNYDCDTNGKPWPPAKPAKLHVAPLGPKGGVMNPAAVAQVKAKTTKKPLHPATPGSYEIKDEGGK